MPRRPLRRPAPARRAPAVLALLPLLLLAGLLAGCAGTGVGTGAAPASAGAGGGTRPLGAQPPTYVALGASDAYGIGTDDPDRLNWPTDVARDLRTPVHLVNLAIPGATVSQAQQTELPVALAVHPAIVTIWLAVNDLADGVALDTYTQQLTALVTSLRRGTAAQIYLGNLPDLTLVPYFNADDPTALGALVGAWNAAIAAVCATTGAHLVDLHAGWSDLAHHPEYISGDGLHPSTAGAQLIAQTFAVAIRATSAP